MRHSIHRPSARPLVAAAAVLGAIAALGGCASPEAGPTGSGDPIKIGVDAALTGYLSASSDIPFVEGVKLAVQSINDAGGVLGRQLDVSVVDDASDAGTGVSAATKLITQDRVDVLMGGSLSAQCSGVAPIALSHQVPMTCIAPPPEDGADYVFQVAAGLAPMLATQLGFAASELGAKDIAFIFSQTPYGQAGEAVTKALSGKFGLNVVFSEGVDANSSDLAPLMAKIKDASPDAVLDFLTGPAHIVEAKGAETAQLGVPIVQTTDVTSVFRQASDEYDDLYFLTLPPQAYPSIPDADLKAANEAFAEAFDGDVDTIGQAAYGWDAVHILAAAMEQSQATTGPDLRDALESLTYQGALSQFAYSAEDHSGEKTVANPNSIAHFVDGELTVVYSAEGS